jgi:hypothetical protein
MTIAFFPIDAIISLIAKRRGRPLSFIAEGFFISFSIG